jgi:hypothetical protein
MLSYLYVVLVVGQSIVRSCLPTRGSQSGPAVLRSFIGKATYDIHMKAYSASNKELVVIF